MEASCESDGKWTLLANFSCIRECTNPPSLTFGRANEVSALEGSSVTYTCDAGYNSIADIKSMCTAMGNWTAPSQLCLRECTNPPSLTFGRANEVSALEGSSVTYTCDAGYNSIADIKSMCTAMGNWTAPSQLCLKECTNPPSLTFGRANEVSVLEGSSVTYTCDAGYNSIADIKSMCTAMGNWTAPSQLCLRECTNPPSLTFGRANEVSALEGSSVTYTCDAGYNSIADIKSMCTAMGNWTAPSQLCLRECTNPPSLTFGRANEASALEGSSVTYTCDAGYNSIADIKSMCTAMGNWTAPSQLCLRECVNPPSLTLGTANESSALEGSSVIYMCDNGYNSVADITSTCNADGNWTAPSSHCLRGVLRSK
ncbi:hypothetical protein CHS0354_025273 [Potamilus streckersoni]|uniref:Sushi domain-containing protein n=1 Tax=Potamilus streckersoni TaxID=2493646 RepID=A0AAE0RRT1_9BIVA|nr:hypothetical protein CHS0354_025273 [Potamilus streckersoni]